jgi:hypothetical protein
MRFRALRKNVPGISARVLTDRLRTLEQARFVYRSYEQTIPPTVTYGITETDEGHREGAMSARSACPEMAGRPFRDGTCRGHFVQIFRLTRAEDFIDEGHRVISVERMGFRFPSGSLRRLMVRPRGLLFGQ